MPSEAPTPGCSASWMFKVTPLSPSQHAKLDSKTGRRPLAMEDQSHLDTRWDGGWRPPSPPPYPTGERRGVPQQLAQPCTGLLRSSGRPYREHRMHCGSTEANLSTVGPGLLLFSRLL